MAYTVTMHIAVQLPQMNAYSTLLCPATKTYSDVKTKSQTTFGPLFRNGYATVYVCIPLKMG